ncbi:MAG TPA: hypothetical protein VKT00_12800 [Casimicrobiaceae bacterium]|nr:hypothetical protein [Casimicrobiaceae bacterium]
MTQRARRDDRPVVIVVGCDDIGSAIARALHLGGAGVVLIDDADPPWPRRGMSYADAWYVGGATLANIDACFCASVKSIPAVLDRGDTIAATTWSLHGVAVALRPIAFVDSRAIARAPAFASRVDAGHSGRFLTRHRIAERVERGELLGEVSGEGVHAPVSGVLHGLAARGARVVAGQTLAEIDESGDASRCFGVSLEAQAAAQNVLCTLGMRLRASRGGAVPEAPGPREFADCRR